MLQFFYFYSTFHVFDGAAYPYKPSRPIPLDPITNRNEGLFTIEQLYQWRFFTVYYRHFPPDRLNEKLLICVNFKFQFKLD